MKKKKETYQEVAKAFSVWAWGKQVPNEVSDLEQFFLRFLKETKRI